MKNFFADGGIRNRWVVANAMALLNKSIIQQESSENGIIQCLYVLREGLGAGNRVWLPGIVIAKRATIWGRLRKRKKSYAKPVAAAVAASEIDPNPYRVCRQDTQKTPTDTEIETSIAVLVDALHQQGAQLRG